MNGASAATSALAGSLRRSSRRKVGSGDFDSDTDRGVLHSGSHGAGYESDADSTYQPSEETRREVAETEADGAITDGDVVHAGESTALALFLAFAGGVGQLASGVLGAEVTGPRE